MKVRKLLLMLFAATVLLTGCKKDNDNASNSNKLQGVWSDGPYQFPNGVLSRSRVYDFINSNTVICYVGTTNEYDSDYISFPNHSGWYYYYSYTITYVFNDNKVIFSNGTILTYMNGQLYLEGASNVLTRW